MKKAGKVWLIVAFSLIGLGLILFGGAMCMMGWDFSRLSTGKYETNEHEICENYQNITIVTNTADVVFVPSEGTESRVVCYEQEKGKHSVSVKDGALVIELEDTRKWYEYIGINFGNSKITVSIPSGTYGALSVKNNTGAVEIAKDFRFESLQITENTGKVTNYASVLHEIKITTSTGDICVEDASMEALDLSVSTGRVTVTGVACDGDISVKVSTGKTVLTDVSCKSLITNGSTGGVSLKNVIASERFSIKRSTGSVKFEDCDAAEILVETDTGDVRGSLLSEKVFITKSDTGSVNVPNSITGGRCEITTDTGDIKITVK